MAEQGKPQSRARAWTWPVGGVRPFPGVLPPRSEFFAFARIRQWAAREVVAGRLLPWLAVAYGLGIVLYFTAEREPSIFAAAALALATIAGTVLLRRRAVAFVAMLGLCGIACGFATGTLKTALIGHPVLHYPGIMALVPQAF
jgi:competence protein ComEC